MRILPWDTHAKAAVNSRSPEWQLRLGKRVVAEKISKAEAHYVDRSMSNDDCDDCIHFEVLAPRHCEKVEGIINPEGWCKLFARKSRMAEHFEKAS